MTYTENDMIAFAEMCGIRGECGFAANRGKWLIDDIGEISTRELLESFKRMRIPPLPSIDDLQNVDFGQPSNSDTKY